MHSLSNFPHFGEAVGGINQPKILIFSLFSVLGMLLEMLLWYPIKYQLSCEILKSYTFRISFLIPDIPQIKHESGNEFNYKFLQTQSIPSSQTSCWGQLEKLEIGLIWNICCARLVMELNSILKDGPCMVLTVALATLLFLWWE